MMVFIQLLMNLKIEAMESGTRKNRILILMEMKYLITVNPIRIGIVMKFGMMLNPGLIMNQIVQVSEHLLKMQMVDFVIEEIKFMTWMKNIYQRILTETEH